MAGNLHELVQQATKKDVSGKIRLGYTVDSYGGVLSYLQQVYSALQKNQNVSQTSAPASILRNGVYDYNTHIGSINILSNHVSGDGFVVDGTDYEKFRQQQLRLSSFMSFVVELPDSDGARVPFIVPYKSPCGTLQNGIGISGKATFPSTNIDSTFCESCSGGLGSKDNPFQMGVAVDLTDEGTVDSFFKMCYKKIYKKGCGNRAAAKGALMAEIAFVDGGTAATLHAKVIANSGPSPTNAAHTIYLPVPLLLTQSYRTLVTVNFSNGKAQTVGQGDCKYPLENSRYNHTNGTLSEYTPNYLLRILREQNRVLRMGEECTVTFKSKTNDGIGFSYVRFYIDKSKDISGVFETDTIPQEYQTELYKGIGEASVEKIQVGWDDAVNTVFEIGEVRPAIGTGTPPQGKSTDTCFYYENQVNWNSKWLKANKPEVVRYGALIEAVAKAYNINTRMFLAQICLETGYLTAPAWKKVYNPGGLTSTIGHVTKENARNLGKQFGNVVGWADYQRLEGGLYFCFHTPEDGLRAKACQVVNNEDGFVGINKRGDKTVRDYFYGIQTGAHAYAASGGTGYSRTLENIYEVILAKP